MMARTRREPERRKLAQESAIAGVLALLVDARERAIAENEKGAPKTEVILARVGLAVEDIVALTGKSTDAVRKTIQRGRAR
jgi:DNA-directed RNA polymerase specialized sigma24 family protein